MSDRRIKSLIAIAFMGMGFGIIAYHLGWWSVLGLFLFAFGNNLEQSNK